MEARLLQLNDEFVLLNMERACHRDICREMECSGYTRASIFDVFKAAPLLPATIQDGACLARNLLYVYATEKQSVSAAVTVRTLFGSRTIHTEAEFCLALVFENRVQIGVVEDRPWVVMSGDYCWWLAKRK